MAIVEANGINISYELDGPEGAPWVTFITGITNDTTMWDDHIPALSENFRSSSVFSLKSLRSKAFAKKTSSSVLVQHNGKIGLLETG